MNLFEKKIPPELVRKFQKALSTAIAEIPDSDVDKSVDPSFDTKYFSKKTARDAALLSGALSMWPGPAGFLTILPDLVGVWRLQAQLVADIAAAHGKSKILSKEVMARCLFGHLGGDAVADILARGGQRILATRLTGRLAARWVPFVGAGVLAAYSYQDTIRVGENAHNAFGS